MTLAPKDYEVTRRIIQASPLSKITLHTRENGEETDVELEFWSTVGKVELLRDVCSLLIS
jgi:hypothetical protein